MSIAIKALQDYLCDDVIGLIIPYLYYRLDNYKAEKKRVFKELRGMFMRFGSYYRGQSFFQKWSNKEWRKSHVHLWTHKHKYRYIFFCKHKYFLRV